MTDKTMYDALINDLLDGDAEARRQATDKLVQGGQPAIESLLRAIHEDDHNESMAHHERLSLRKAMIKIGEPAFQALIEALTEQSSLIRGRAAVKTLVLFNDARAVEPLIKVTLDKQYGQNTRCYAIDALAYFKDPRAFEPLIAVLEDDDVLMVGHAARTLGEYRDKRALAPLKKALARSGTTPWMDWKDAVREAIRATRNPNYRPLNRGFFINERYNTRIMEE